MDGVKPVSVGLGAILRDPARMGCTGRVQVQPQPVVSVHNGSRLGCSGRRPAMEYVHRQKVDASGDPYIHIRLADRILARTSLLSASPRKFAFCNTWFNIDLWHDGNHHPAQKHAKLFYKKRGV